MLMVPFFEKPKLCKTFSINIPQKQISNFRTSVTDISEAVK